MNQGHPTQQATPRVPRPRERRQRSNTPFVAPLVALVGLTLIGGGSLWAASVLSALEPGAAPTLGPSGGVEVTPTPIATAVITPPPERQASVTGTILFTRAGDVYAVSGTKPKRITNKGTDSSPVWSPNGRTIYFVQTIQRTADRAAGEGGSKMTFYATDLMSIPAGGGQRKRLFESMFQTPQGAWSTTLIQPDVSPDGTTLAVASDLGVVPSSQTDISSVVLSLINNNGNRLRGLGIRTARGLGHNDPDWSPDGKTVAFTYNDKSRDIGTPKIGLYNVKANRLRLLRRGYASPSWSPDGRFLVAEATTGVGRDIVIIDPDSGALGEVIAQLTRDGDSFRPVWSPNGDQIAYLHRNGTDIDLWIATLSTSAEGAISLVDRKPVTEDGRVDVASRPSWFIPEDQLKPVATLLPPTAAPSAGEGSAAP